jgi:ribonucleotide monophosphatase NagD (HAD superfamily)
MSADHRNQATTGFVIDLSAILTRTSTKTIPAPGAREAISKLQKDKVPFAIVAKDARMPRNEVSSSLEKHLGLTIDASSVIMPETPFHWYIRDYRDKVVLVVGDWGAKARSTALHYGFKHVMVTQDVLGLYPHIYCDPPSTPTREPDGSTNPPWKPLYGDEVRISAIFVFCASADWDYDMRIVTDLLMSQAGYIGTHSRENLAHLKHTPELQPRLYICTAETDSRDGRKVPLKDGKTWLKTLWERYRAETGLPLDYSYHGTGSDETTINYADYVLQKRIKKLHPDFRPFPKTVYMIGKDIPFSVETDKQKAWQDGNTRRRSIRIDRYKARCEVAIQDYHPLMRPWHVAANLKEAVDYALTEEYWELAEKGLTPMFPRPQGSITLVD